MIAIVFDTETTDLKKHPSAPLERQPQVIEVGAVKLSWPEGRIVGELSLLINPGVPLSDDIVRITGITDDMLVGQPSWAEAEAQVAAFFSGADITVAHNHPFDRAMIEFEAARTGNPFPWAPLSLCTVQENEPLWGRRPKLIELYERSTGNVFIQQHRAMDDCARLAEIVIQERYLDRVISSTASAH